MSQAETPAVLAEGVSAPPHGEETDDRGGGLAKDPPCDRPPAMPVGGMGASDRHLAIVMAMPMATGDMTDATTSLIPPLGRMPARGQAARGEMSGMLQMGPGAGRAASHVPQADMSGMDPSRLRRPGGGMSEMPEREEEGKGSNEESMEEERRREADLGSDLDPLLAPDLAPEMMPELEPRMEEPREERPPPDMKSPGGSGMENQAGRERGFNIEEGLSFRDTKPLFAGDFPSEPKGPPQALTIAIEQFGPDSSTRAGLLERILDFFQRVETAFLG